MATVKRFGTIGEKKTGSKTQNFRQSKLYQAYWQLPVALIIVLILFFGAKAALAGLTSGHLAWYWLNFWSLVISIAILSGATAAIKDDNKVDSTAIAWFLITIFALVMIRDYSRLDHKAKKTVAAEQTTIILRPGTYIFNMQGGETTAWLHFPKGIDVHYDISSTSHDYIIDFADGAVYSHGVGIKIPEKENTYFKIKAVKPQTVTIKVAERLGG